MTAHFVFACLLLSVCAAAFLTKILTLLAVIVASAIAIVIYAGTGFTGIVLLGAFFLLGVLATSWKKEWKQRPGENSPEENGRDAYQVLANGGAAALLSVLAVVFGTVSMWPFLIACAFASAAADTVSSELGMVYGKKFFNIVSLQPAIKGDNGVVSFEGSLFGILASTIIACLYSVMQGFHFTTFSFIVIAGTIGNFADSILGATLERNGLIGNNAVNFLNTIFAVMAGFLLSAISSQV
jgi:uncharacterized protein (TIGR00297 family)